ncbi:BrxA family protein, partial [Salmonella sp. SAL4362]
SPVVKDFLAEVVNDLCRQFKEKLPMDSWDEFVANHLRQQPVLTSYSDSSIKKMGNNLIKALAEAGYLDTPRRRNLQSVFLLPETQATLQRLG